MEEEEVEEELSPQQEEEAQPLASQDIDAPPPVPEGALWREVLTKVVPAVVVIKTTAPRTFDTELAGSGQATGFIVDKTLGIILTNRHVVRPGPVIAEAVFLNHQEIPIHPLYRDPVHDFGFFHFDPEAVQYLECTEIPLAPEAAVVGLEVRVVGNDSKEKISIMASTLARLDRDAPTYKRNGYNDFNIFYLQAASGTKGGSSGSPVIDCHGHAVAMNAGGRNVGASAFFLPLERVVRALKILQKGKDLSTRKWLSVQIPRGTLQVTFLHKGFNDAVRLGLKKETEQMVRQASPEGETGMLVVDSVVPGGPAHGHLEPGDVLVCVNGEVTTQFLSLETSLDESVGSSINLQLERGGITMNTTLRVQDLHSITPDHFLEVSGGVIHPLSYQQARNFQFTCGLVYIAEPGYMLSRAAIPRHAVIKKLAGETVQNLDDFLSAFTKLSPGIRVPLEYIIHSDRHRRKTVLVATDKHEWYSPPQLYKRDDSTGIWQSKLAISCPIQEVTAITVSSEAKEPTCLPECSSTIIQVETVREDFVPLDNKEKVSVVPTNLVQEGDMDTCKTAGQQMHGCSEDPNVRDGKEQVSATDITTTDCPIFPGSLSMCQEQGRRVGGTRVTALLSETIIETALVMCEVDIPHCAMLDGVRIYHSRGTGVIVHHSQNLGLVAVDKNTVPLQAADLMLGFAAYPIEIPGEVVFLHPVHNYALVAYNPSALGLNGFSAVHAADLLPDPPLQRGDEVYLVGLGRNLQAKSRKSIVTNPSVSINIGVSECPKYRAINMEVIELDTDLGYAFSGVLADKLGRIQALWSTFSYQGSQLSVRGIPTYTFSKVVNDIINAYKGTSFLIDRVIRPMPVMHILEAELYPTILSKARSFGLSNNWVLALAKKDPLRRQVLRVRCCLSASKAQTALEQGDMILAINGEPVTSFWDIEDACSHFEDHEDSSGGLKLTVFRKGKEMEICVGTDVRDGFGTTRMVNWSGGILQVPHPAVRALGFLPQEGHGVYVASLCHGSPAQRYGLHTSRWIIGINGKATPNLDAFLEIIKDFNHGDFIRVRTVKLNGKPRVLALKQDLHYWPTWELCFNQETAKWERKVIKSNNQ